MDDPYLEWEIGKRAWAAFPKAATIIVTMVLTLIQGSVRQSISVGISIWIILNLARLLMREIYMYNTWYIVGLPIKTISAWPILWLLVAISVFVGNSMGITKC